MMRRHEATLFWATLCIFNFAAPPWSPPEACTDLHLFMHDPTGTGWGGTSLSVWGQTYTVQPGQVAAPGLDVLVQARLVHAGEQRGVEGIVQLLEQVDLVHVVDQRFLPRSAEGGVRAIFVGEAV